MPDGGTCADVLDALGLRPQDGLPRTGVGINDIGYFLQALRDPLATPLESGHQVGCGISGGLSLRCIGHAHYIDRSPLKWDDSATDLWPTQGDAGYIVAPQRSLTR